jgi:GxxExxY protein
MSYSGNTTDFNGITTANGINGMLNRLQTTNSSDELLAKQIIGLAMKVHRTLGCGFLESVYANALLIELRKAGIHHEREKVYPVRYEEVEVGVFHADLVIENRLIVEMKSVEALSITHSVQLVNYLAAAEIDLGLLLNFGTRSLEFKTKTRVFRGNPQTPILI